MTVDSMTQIENIIRLLRTQHSNNQGSVEQHWIQTRVNDPSLKAAVSCQSIISFHILSALENGEKTGISLAKQLGVSRGGVTRAAKKLMADDLIKACKHPEDRKKIYYSLSGAGTKIAQAHDKLHQEINQQINQKLRDKYSDEDLAVVTAFLRDLAELEQGLLRLW